MYRFSIGDEDWIIIFSQHLSLEKAEKEEIIRSIATMGPSGQHLAMGSHS